MVTTSVAVAVVEQFSLLALMGWGVGCIALEFLGCHEKYARKEDVVIQTRLANAGVVVREDLQAVIDDIVAWHEKEY